MADQSIEQVVIIGSGPAGWTAAIYAARANLRPVVYVGVPATNPAPVLPGGQLMMTTEVENYPGFPHGVTGPEMMQKFQEQAERFGTRVVGDDIVHCDFSQRPFTLKTGDGKTVRAHSVIIATGATANWLGLKNELHLAQTGGGVSACAVCDGALPIYRGATVAVVGGGDTAMEEASYLTKFAGKVLIIHRRDSFRAEKIMQDRLFKNPKVEVLWNHTVDEVLGDDTPLGVTAVRARNVNTGDVKDIPCAGFFVAIGHAPASDLVKDQLELHNGGYVKVEPGTTRTSIPGVFAAGDLTDHVYRQAVTSAGMGCMAALDAERWLSGH